MTSFEARPAVRAEEPLLIGIVGPPGGGKTLSSLRLAKGIQSVRGGPIICIDTEGGRSRKYADLIPFECFEFNPPCRSEIFLNAIQFQLPRNPAAIIVDSLSDEHEGEGGYLEWHDELVPKMGGNEWAAWARPKASRKRLISGILHIKTPLIFTFRAREKTQQTKTGSKTTVINIGWQPVAPLEIVHTLDLVCLLPPRADGVPVWKSDKVGEDFIIKLPNYLKQFITKGQPLSEKMGAAFAEWARGPAPVSPQTPSVVNATAVERPVAPHQSERMGAGAAGESVSVSAADSPAHTPAADPAPSLAPIPIDAASGAGALMPDEPLSLQDMAREAASRGEDVFQAFYKSRSPGEKAVLRGMGEEIREIFKQAKEPAP